MKPFPYNVIKIEKWDGSNPIMFMRPFVQEFRRVKGMTRIRSIKVPRDLFEAYANIVKDTYTEEHWKERRKEGYLFFRGVRLYYANGKNYSTKIRGAE